jgi:riboflavin synthase
MFTGIVEGTGAIRSVSGSGQGARVRLAARLAGRRPNLGESISVDGVCLTVVRRGNGWFDVDLSPETLRVTTLGERGAGSAVNLERALRAGDRLGGHFVQGHVDGVGTVRSVRRAGTARVITFQAPEAVSAYLVSRGSVAVDGVSLTVTEVGAGRFQVVLIPHTLAVTTLRDLRPGRRVNLEADILGKYVRAFLDAAGGAPPRGSAARRRAPSKGRGARQRTAPGGTRRRAVVR